MCLGADEEVCEAGVQGLLQKLVQVISRQFKYPYKISTPVSAMWQKSPRDVSDPVSAVAQRREQGKVSNHRTTASQTPVTPARETPGQPIAGVCTEH